jgi:hypothetical protein
MNRSSHLLFALLLATAAAPSVACVSASDDNTDAEDADLKKKVKPKAGNGALDLLKPSFATTAFVGQFSFDGTTMNPGDRREKVPGSYILQTTGNAFADGTAMTQKLAIPITAGTIAKQTPGGLRVRFAEPVTLGGVRVGLTPEQGYEGVLEANTGWHKAATGAQLLVLPGKVTLSPATETTKIDAVITEGAVKEIVLPTSRVAIQLDAFDAAYPTPSNCTAPYLRAGASGYTSTEYIRTAAGVPNASFVVPQGTRTDLILNVYGYEWKQATVSGATHTFMLNRLEVDDVEVALSGGGTQMVAGTYTIARKNDLGTWVSLNCSAPTHTGMDLPDGTYRVTSSARAASGPVSYVEEISFP